MASVAHAAMRGDVRSINGDARPVRLARASRRAEADTRGRGHPMACEAVVNVRWGGEGGVRVRAGWTDGEVPGGGRASMAEARFDRRYGMREGSGAEASARAAVGARRA